MKIEDIQIPESFASPAEHREWIVRTFDAVYRAKYDKGQAEHGGYLFEKDCSVMALEEALDFVSYSLTELVNKRKAIAVLERAERFPQTAMNACQVALELLRGKRKD